MVIALESATIRTRAKTNMEEGELPGSETIVSVDAATLEVGAISLTCASEPDHTNALRSDVFHNDSQLNSKLYSLREQDGTIFS